MKAEVVGVRVRDHVANALDAAMELLGGWRRVVDCGETIILKPNLVAPRPSKTGATTSLELLAQVAERLKDFGARPVLFETPGMEYRVEETWRFFDLPTFARSHGAELLLAHASDWVWVEVPGGKVLRRARVHRAILEHRLINLPKLKTHIITGATLAMKNLMGVCHDDTKRAMHIVGINRAIVDLNRLIRPPLNIIDGTVGMEGDGAVYGIPKQVGMLIASTNALAADLVGLELMGLKMQQVAHLGHAIGDFGMPTIEKLGDPFTSQAFLLPSASRAYRFAYRMLYVIDTLFYRTRGIHFNEYLYRHGIVGTRPYIVKNLCDGCGRCLESCQLPECLDLVSKVILTDKCLRCLECVNSCLRGAIKIKGISGNKKTRHQ